MKTLIYFGFLLFIFSCSKEKDCSKVPSKLITADRIIPDTERTYLPYTGSETLVFVSNKGDTAILIGTGSIQKYTKERIVFKNEDATCPQTNVHRHETFAAEFKGTNPNFSHFKIEQFMSYGDYSIFRFYYNNMMERVSSTYPYEWDGKIAYAFAKGTCILLGSYSIEFRKNRIEACQASLVGNGYPRFLFYQEFGVIAYLLNDSSMYILQ